MINILVTGGNGQLATCIKDVESQHDNLNFIYTDYLELDICDLKQVQAFFESNKQINYCVNCAAYTAVDKAEEDVEKAFEINAIGAKNLALVCNKEGAILIHISTDFVFDGKKSEPYTEKDVANPISVYGASKLQGEVKIQQKLKEHFILRTSWLYSEHCNNFLKTMLRLSKDRDELNVISDQIGTPTYAGDLAEVILKIIVEENNLFGIYHYSNEGVVSWYAFAKAIFDESKINMSVSPIKTEDYPTSATRPKYSVMDKSKIKEKLKIEILDWKESLKKCLIKNRS
ncbi:dTDP-4-dehydrorhamnose reductase [Thalassobellus suaedae]|uniref:dTDP-4-dehydrorhamnose reductase n=1 Tax=Thalassobellus suaedae TaxID=3074124 RepID=A0ABY9Y778_9FLAO|nr:dTDP-4-dehydrorhamnose reductase [Flavobacteriaceae bacterium HL-DH10]